MSNQNTTIAVTGASGHLGRLVVQGLKAKGAASVVALARAPEKVADLGVEARAFDYARTETLAPALQGVDVLLLVSGTDMGQRTAQHRGVIEAARAAGAGRIVYTSLLRADTSPLSLAGEHVETEAALKDSGVPFTVLRNGWYTENYAGSIGGALAGGAFLGSAKDGRISSAARADYAEAAVAALLGEGHGGRTYELAGDGSYTLSDLAAEISRQAGREIPYRDVPEADYAQALAGFGLPEPMAQAIAGWDVGASEGALFDEGRELSALIGRPTTPMADTVAETLKGLS